MRSIYLPIYVLLSVFPTCVAYADGGCYGNDTYYEQVVPDGQPPEDVKSVDVWYGPGYYYGYWFDDEDIYWVWRRKHAYYPPNRSYYNHNRPIYFSGSRRDDRGRGPSDYQQYPRRGDYQPSQQRGDYQPSQQRGDYQQYPQQGNWQDGRNQNMPRNNPPRGQG